MDKCKYCTSDEIGDIPDDAKWIFEKNHIEIGKIGNIPIWFDLEIGPISGEKDQCDIVLFNLDPDGVVDEEYAWKLDFKYCPMCGRRLNI